MNRPHPATPSRERAGQNRLPARERRPRQRPEPVGGSDLAPGRADSRPRQYLFVNPVRAIELGHKVAFHVDASRIARLPLTADYFPGLADRMVRVIGHDPDFVVKVEQRLRELIAAGFRITKVDAVQDRESRPR
jgi:hypothetical protein